MNFGEAKVRGDNEEREIVIGYWLQVSFTLGGGIELLGLLVTRYFHAWLKNQTWHHMICNSYASYAYGKCRELITLGGGSL
jgi:hypothetical protein